MDGYIIPGSLDITRTCRYVHVYIRTQTHHNYVHVLDPSEKLRMREIKLVTRKWRRILRKLLDLTKSPSERYKLSKDHVRPVSKWLCEILRPVFAPCFVLGCF